MTVELFIALLSSSVELGVILLFGCLGETLMEKAGHLNLGIPGIMCAGAAGGCLGAWIPYTVTENPLSIFVVLCAIFFAALFAGALGGVYAFLTISLRANQNVTGLVLTIFGGGFATFFLNTVIPKSASTTLTSAGMGIFKAYPAFIDNLGWFGEIFLAHGFLAYLAILLAIFFGFMLKRTRIGLNLRAIGESRHSRRNGYKSK